MCVCMSHTVFVIVPFHTVLGLVMQMFERETDMDADICILIKHEVWPNPVRFYAVCGRICLNGMHCT